MGVEIVRFNHDVGSEELRAFWRRRQGSEPPEMYRHEIDLDDGTGYSIIIGREVIDHDDARWHLSIAHSRRLPEWRHLVAATHHFLPEKVMCVPLPPVEWWVNENEFCLHVWEVTKDEPLIATWREGGRGDTPT